MIKYKQYIIFTLFSFGALFIKPLQLYSQSPSLIFPSNSYNTSSNSINFSWEDIFGSNYYELDLAEDSLFSIKKNTYRINSGTDTTIKELDLCKTYYWRVRNFAPLAGSYSLVRHLKVFSPKCIPGLNLWLAADSGIVKNGSNEVTQWLDRSGTGKNALQLNPSAQPLWHKDTSAISNKSSFVRMDGNDDLLEIDSSMTVNSMFTVFNWKGSLPNFSGFNTLLNSKVLLPKGIILMGFSGQANYYDDGTYNRFVPGEIDIDGVTTFNMTPLSKLKMLTGISSNSASFPSFVIGKYPSDNSSFWNGDIGEIIIYDTALDSIKKYSVESYLNDKYAPSVNLGGGITACSFPIILHAKKDYFTSYVWQDTSTDDSLVVNSAGTYYVTTTNIFGRKSSDTVKIILDNSGYTVNLGNDTTICSGESIKLYAGPSHLSYTWSIGSTSNSITVNSTGSYSVIMTDCLGNITKDTVNITVNPLPVFSLGNDTLICYNSSPYILDPGFINSSIYSFIWSNTTIDSLLSITQSNTYWLRVSDIAGCLYNDTVKITIDNFPTIASLGNDTSLCSGNSIYLQSGAGQATNYLWNDGSTNTSLQVINPVGTNTYWLTASDINSCSKIDTIGVTIVGTAPISDFTFTTTCLGNATQYTDLTTSASTITSWVWNFGEPSSGVNDTSTAQNSQHYYANAGTYTVRLTTRTNVGCESSINKVITIHPKPIVSFTTTNLCSNLNVQFTATAITFGEPITQWNWNFEDIGSGANNLSILQNPSHSFKVLSSYPVQLIVENIQGCKDSIIENIIISIPQIPVELIFPTSNYNTLSNSINFSWEEICGSNYYELDLAEDSLFSIKKNTYRINSGTDTTIKELDLCKTYYWRVRNFAPLAGSYSLVRHLKVFSPKCIPGLNLWLAADSGIVKNGSNEVTQWLDRSGTGKNALQLNPSAQPLWHKDTSAISNKSSFVRMDGNDDLLEIDSSMTVNSMFTVFNWKGSLPNFSGFNTLLNSKVLLPKGIILMGFSGQANYYDDGTYNRFVPGEIDIDGVTTFNMTPLSKLKMLTGISSNSASFPSFVIGKYPSDNSSFWNGDIGEIIIYDTALDSIKKYSVESYLNDKYAPSVNLGGGITACSFPIILHAKKDYFTSYVWQDTSTDDSLVVNSAGTYYVTTTNIFGRKSSDTVKIILDNSGYTVNLGNDTTICSGESIKLYAGPSHLSYTWSIGSTSNSITVNSTGSYSVIMTDCLGNITKDTVNITVNPLPVFSLGNDTLICYNSSPYILDPGFINSSIYSFIWSNTTIDSLLSITQSNTYWLRVSDIAGCLYNDTVKITIDNFPTIASLGNDTSLCSGNSIYLQSGAGQATNYLWNDGSTNTSLTIISTGQYWVTVSSINSCSKQDTINITIAGSAPTANFSNNTTCFGNATNFTDLSVPPGADIITNWLWNFGEPSSGVNNTSTLQNPIHVYADTGSYTVKLLVTTNAGCGAILSKTIKIYSNPQISFTTNNLCEGEGTKFVGQVITVGYPITQWNWIFGDPSSGTNNVSSLQNPTHIYSGSGAYSVRLIGQNSYGCADTVINNISIKNPPVADFNYLLACKNSSVQFTDNSILPPATSIQNSYWNFGGSSTSSLINPTHTFTSSITYNVLHVITATNGCLDSIIKPIVVYPEPKAFFSYGNVCVNSPVSFSDLSVISGGTITSWWWNFGGTTSTVQNSQNSFSNTGNSNVKLIISTDKGCKDSISKIIVVNPNPIPNFTFSPSYGTPPAIVNFTNTSSGALSYIWDFDDGTQSSLVNPSHNYLTSRSYQISLTARNNYGCEKSIVKIFDVFEQYLDVAILDISTSLQNNFLSITANIANTGNTDVTSMEFYVKVKDGPALKEKWTGLFKATSIINYNFSSSPYLENKKDVICVSVLKPNGVDDQVAINNELCKALDDSEFKVLDIYPNPSNDILTIPFIIPEDDKILTITIYNVKGDLVKNAYSDYLSKGLQAVVINTVELTSGLYACKIEYKNQTVVKTFLKY